MTDDTFITQITMTLDKFNTFTESFSAMHSPCMSYLSILSSGLNDY